MSEIIYEAIKDSDGVDCYIKRGEVVRCEDCMYRNTWDNPRLEPQYYKCGMGVKFRDYGYVREDDYCPLGKRREDGEA